jgi:hypothetical protein
MWSLLTVLLVIGGCVLVPYSLVGGALAFLAAFGAAGLAYAAQRDLELFMGVCLILAAIKAAIDVAGKWW